MDNEALSRLLHERACERLVIDYTHLVDFGEAARIADLFTESGVWEAEGIRMEGRDAIRAGFGARQGVTRRTSRHVCTNVAITLTGPDEATGISYLLNYRHDSTTGTAERPAPVGHPKFVGEYHDRFVRTADGWRIAHRRCTLAFVRARGAGA
ncbi:MAG: nuclear transport factor 2 family protein [Deltaproteobacteria bacterium]|nr:nuclear transport factor 2 family protein [Deltaproteobacteria bacterium]